MQHFYSKVAPGDPFRQGDIFSIVGSEDDEWGVLITADCDIAKGKFGENLTYIRLIRASEYLNAIWAREKVASQLADLLSEAITVIHKVDSRRDADVKPLTAADIHDWLGADGPEGIASSLLTAEGKEQVRLLALLSQIKECWAGAEANSYLGALRKNATAQGKGDKAWKNNLREALTNPRAEFFYIPSVPQHDDHGFMLLLRDVRSIHRHNVFSDVTSKKLSDTDADIYLLRLGRFSDVIRHSIAQQFATLFSRIGLPEHFEHECSASADLILEGI